MAALKITQRMVTLIIIKASTQKKIYKKETISKHRQLTGPQYSPVSQVTAAVVSDVDMSASSADCSDCVLGSRL